MKKFSGVGVALVTPFDETGRVDEYSLRNLVNYVIEGGVDYLVALGTTSEAATMTAEERALVVRIVAEENAGRLPIVLGIGGNNTAQVIHDLATLPYLRQGDAILSVTPYYNKPSQQGLYNHFKAIAEHTPLPVILYNVPGRTSVNMTAAITLKLAVILIISSLLKRRLGILNKQRQLLQVCRRILFSCREMMVLLYRWFR